MPCANRLPRLGRRPVSRLSRRVISTGGGYLPPADAPGNCAALIATVATTPASAPRPVRRYQGSRAPAVISRAVTAPSLGQACVDTRGQPVAPCVDASAGAGTEQLHLGKRVDRVHVVEETVELEVEVRKQVSLVHEHPLDRAEHDRVLEWLVLALGDRGHHDLDVFADVELGGAHKI